MRFFVFLLLLVPAMAGAADPEPGPLWPLALDTRYLTSNFMEWRGGRFHAGIDLKTRSREGFVVRAVEDGYLSRVRCTPTAYGRVVYMRGESGKTYVYAHLQRFSDDLWARVSRAQEESGQYRTSLHFQPGDLRVKRGDVLGLSGQSGTGGPHLHFEVRDRGQRPLNPLDHGFAVDDRLPPVIHSLTAWPASGESRVFGKTGEWILKAGEDGLQGDLGVLPVNGPVAFSARMVDASDIAGHKLEPWLIELRLDGEVVYRCRNEVFAFDENGLQRLEWTDRADWTDTGVSRERWLHRRPANTLVGREGQLWYSGEAGTGLAAGLHHLELKVADHRGNTTAVRWQLLVTEAAPAEEKSPWIEQPLGLRFPEHGPLALTPFYSVGDPAVMGITVLRLEPGPDPVMEPTELWVKEAQEDLVPAELASGQGLRSAGPRAIYMAADWPVESAVPVVLTDTVPEVANPARLGVYRLKGGQEWVLVNEVRAGPEPSFNLSDPGLHAVFEDVGAPIMEIFKKTMEVHPAEPRGIEGVSDRRWQSTPISVYDPGSGLDTGAIRATLNGQRIILEPDPPRDRVLVHWPDELEPGAHELVIEVADRAGNTSRRAYFVLLEPGESPE